MGRLTGKTALVTGASSGIGRATAMALAGEGARVILAARRAEKLEDVSRKLVQAFGAEASGVLVMDVRDREDVRQAAQQLEKAGWHELDILINNAGLAAGLTPLQEGLFDDWDRMIDTNIKGLLNVTRFFLPGMVDRGRGHIVNIGSIAGREFYPSGNVYCGTKAFVRAINRGLRVDLLGRGIRVSSIDPGMVRTEFSEVRFHGDSERAEQVYRGMTPLLAEDVADAVVWVLTRPPHVNVEEILLMPTDQASATNISRR